MALTVHLIPSGDSIQPTGQPFSSLEALRAWIAQEAGIKEEDQIVLTGRGRHVQPQSLLTENTFYLYDRDLFTSSSPNKSIYLDSVPQPWTPPAFPSDLHATDSLKAWQTLFKQRKQWASSILETCRARHESASIALTKRAVIEDGLRVATSKHEGYLQKLSQQRSDVKAWFDDVARDAGANVGLLEEDLEKMGTVPVIPAFGRFFGKEVSQRRRSSTASRPEATLASFVDEADIQGAAAEAKAALAACEDRLEEIGGTLEKIMAEYEGVMQDLSISHGRSLRDDPEEPSKQLKEIQAIANKVGSDYEHVMGLKNDQNALRTASKMALLHTKNYLPSLAESATEMDDLARYLAEAKNTTTQRALQHLQTIARIETAIPTLRKAYDAIELSESGLAALDKVACAGQLPVTYGSLLFEAARRTEWTAKMKHDSAALAEEIAGYTEEEQKRRRKWLRGVANMVSETAVDGKVLGVEVNLQGQEQDWPVVTRDDIQAYISSLQSLSGFESVVESLTQTLKSLDQPTKAQVKRATKAFKMGSVHEAASGFGKGSLMLRGDDETKILRETNLKLEDEAKGYKSRIRKLEDMLHRQSMFNRLSIGGGGGGGGASQSSPFGEQVMSPTPMDQPTPTMSPRQLGDVSRRSSNSSRRVSFNNQVQGQDERQMARRIVQLEADLVAANSTRSKQEKAHQSALDDANSTKKDLMENMEAQQREFLTERRLLEEELGKMRTKLEEMEDEFDRLVGSREGGDAKFQVLLAERDEQKRDAERRVQHLERDLNHRKDLEAERVELLKGLHTALEPDQRPPQEMVGLITALENLIQRSQSQAREVAQAVALARSENGNLQTLLEGQKTAAAQLEAEMEAKESEIKQIQDELRTEKSRAESVQAELDNEREHLRDLREKFAEGETGSSSLRQRLQEEEAKVSSLSNKLAEARSHVNSLDVQLFSIQSKHHQLQEVCEEQKKRLQDRAQRAKAVSQRLYTHNDRLMRLLHALGFVVTFTDAEMKLERASKAGASTIMSDNGAASMIQRTISGSTTTRWIEDLADVSLLLWAEKDSAEDEEDKYSQFMSRIGRFNLDSFAEAITKRMRDMEHTARKYQREARSYRERAHKTASEAHDKIAFRGFKEGDLALFLPTRNQAMKPWAAFNIGAPHYFLREQDSHRLVNRDWLVARISKVEERVVDLSKALNRSTHAEDGRSLSELGEGAATPSVYEDDNPFDLSDGLRWYLLEAQEEKVGAPTTPGLGKAVVSTSTVSATRDDSSSKAQPSTGPTATAIRIAKKKATDAVEEASKALSRSLDSRRSSHSSKRSVPVPAAAASGLGIDTNGTGTGTGNGNGNAGPGPSHLRTASDAASLLRRTSDDEPRAANPAVQEEQRARPQRHLQRQISSTSNASGSPQKSKAGGAWDSLFNYEVNLQSGGRRGGGAG